MSAQEPTRIMKWFQEEVLPWRVYHGIFRSFLLHSTLLFTYMLLAMSSISLSAPWNTFIQLASPSSWLYHLVFCLCLFGTGLLLKKHLTVEPSLVKSQISKPVKLLEPTILLSIFGGAILGGFFIGSLLALEGGVLSSLTKACIEDEVMSKCFNTGHFVVVTSGALCSMLFWIQVIFHNRGLLIFCPFELNGSTQIRMKFIRILKRALVNSFYSLQWFIVFYAVIGYPMSRSLSEIFRMKQVLSVQDLVTSLIKSIVLNTYFFIVMYCSLEIIKINIMKPLFFHLEGDYGIFEAMSKKNATMLRYLAFRDFLQLTKNAIAERNKIFELSQPGGHPRTWTEVADSCMEVIQDFIQELSLSGQIQPQFAPGPLQKPASSTMGSIGKFQNEKSGSFFRAISSIWSKLQKNSLFATFPEFHARSAFAKSQLVIWTIEALSEILCLSVIQDQHGVVQIRLQEILTALMTLQQTVEKHKGLTTSLKKDKYEIRDVQLKQELRSAIKTVLYKISNTFGDSLRDFSLKQDFKTKLNQYLTYME